MNSTSSSPRQAAQIVLDDVGIAGFLDKQSLCDILLGLGVRQTELNGSGVSAGMAHRSKHGWTISVRDTSEPRSMFTLAHEIGHVVFDRVAADGDHAGEESWCNRFAAELLMPIGPVTARFGRAPVAFEAVLELSRVANVSLTSSFIRLNEIRGWRASLLRLRWHRGEWKLLSVIGVPQSAMWVMSPDRATTSIVDGPRRRPMNARLPFTIAETSTTFDVQIYGPNASRWILMDGTLAQALGRAKHPSGGAGRTAT